MLSENEKFAAIREAAKLGAEYRRALIVEGATPADALAAMNNFVIMFLATKGVVPRMDEDDDKWRPDA